MDSPLVQSVLELPDDALEAPPALGSSLGPYQLEKFLGEGTMGRVYLGRHQQLGRQVALKVLHRRHTRNEQLLRRFLQEARTVNHINHEHIVEVHDFVEMKAANLVYCVMEMLHGETLRTRLLREPALTIAQMLKVCLQIGQALAAAHAVGVVHRDVKPDNIMLLKRGESDLYVKVLDFGVAKLLQSANAVRVIDTQNSEAAVGTPRYMSPEQAAGLEVDSRTDVYAFGTVLYEMLAGKPPFLANTFGQLAADIITQAPPLLPTVTAAGETITPAMARLVMNCLAKAADDRPASMTDVCTALEHGGIPTSKGVVVPDTLRNASRPRWVVAAIVSVVVGAVTAGLLGYNAATRDAAPHLIENPVKPAVTPAVAVAPTLPDDSKPMRKRVSLNVTTVPEGATVSRADTHDILGKTPLTVELPASPQPFDLELTLPGHQRLIRQVTADSDVRLELALTPQAPRKRTQKKQTKKTPVREGVLDAFE